MGSRGSRFTATPGPGVSADAATAKESRGSLACFGPLDSCASGAWGAASNPEGAAIGPGVADFHWSPEGSGSTRGVAKPSGRSVGA